MVFLQDFTKSIDYRITGGYEFLWNCFGNKSRGLESEHDWCSVTCIFDAGNQRIYQIDAWDYTNHREYRWTDPEFKHQHSEEAQGKGLDPNESFEGRKFIELEVPEDILKKAQAMINNQPYDTRVVVPLDLSDDEMFDLMKRAHEEDITLNQLVERVLHAAIDSHNNKAVHYEHTVG